MCAIKLMEVCYDSIRGEINEKGYLGLDVGC